MIHFLSQWLPAAGDWLQLLLSSTVKSTFLLAAAGAATLVLHRASAAARHLVWSLAVVGAVLLPLLSLSLPAWPAIPFPRTNPIPGAGASGDDSQPPLPHDDPPQGRDPDGNPLSVSSGASGENEAALPATAPVPPVTPGVAGGPERTGTPLSVLLLAGWAEGALVLLALTATAALSLRRLRAVSERIVTGPFADLLAQLCRELGMQRRIELLWSPRRAMPMTWGILRPKILLPAAAADWPLERRRAVLLHELAHIRRRDCWWELMVRAACALYWFHPLIWFARGRMAVERERACDDLVLRHGCRPADYADHLLQIASSLPACGLPVSAAIAMASPSRLEGRLLVILDERRNRRELTRASKLWTLTLLSVLLPSLAMVEAQEGSPPRRRTSPTRPAEGDERPTEGDLLLRSARAALPGGAAVELIGLSRSVAVEVDEDGFARLPEGSWWKADGTPLEGELSLVRPEDAPASFPGAPSLWLGLRVTGASGPIEARYAWTSSSAPGWTRGDLTRVQGQFVYSSDQGLGLQLVELRIAAIAAPPGDEMLHLRAGVAAGAWKTLAAADTRGAKTVAGEAGSGAVFQAAEAETNQVVLRLMDTVGDVEDRRVVALDRQGGIHSPAWSKVDLLPGARLTTLAFKDVDLAGVKEFRLETRPFHWVEFRNVSLVVGRKTEVEAIAAPGPPGVEVRFVRLVVGLEAMTFEGETATEDALKERLEKVPDRARTVIELAVSGTDLSFARYDAVQQRLLKLKDELGFRSVSHVGEQPLGSRGSPPATAPDSGEAGTRSGGEDGAGSAWRFGPVVARVISGDRGEWMLDLDSGRTHGAVVIGGESSVPEAMDLSFVHAPSERGLQPSAIAALELQFRRGEDKDWDIDPAWIGWRLSIAESPGAPGQPDRSGFRTAPLASAQERLPLTFIFRTRQGNDGVLQFLQITENPGGVKLRYKMVEKAVVPGAPVPAASEDAARTEQRQGGPTRKPR